MCKLIKPNPRRGKLVNILYLYIFYVSIIIFWIHYECDPKYTWVRGLLNKSLMTLCATNEMWESGFKFYGQRGVNNAFRVTIC